MKKNYYYFVVFFISCTAIFAQSLNIYNINSQNYPKMSAKFVLSDKNGDFVRLNSVYDLKITENGIQRTVTSLSCPQNQTAQPISLAISLDVSGSMTSKDGEKTRCEFGKETAINLIKALSVKSEFAVQTCTDIPKILTDFTSDKNAAIEALKPVTAGGNNNFVNQLLDPKSGLLNIAAVGKYNRVAIIFTDAFWPAMDQYNLQNCINICAKYNITLIAIIYSRKDAEPNGIVNSLSQIADASGGFTIEGAVTESIADDIVSNLETVLQFGQPCTVEWQSEGCDLSRSLVFNNPQYNITDSEKVTIPTDVVPQFAYPLGNTADFGPIIPGTFQTMKMTIKAANIDLKVDSISTSNPAFIISDYGGAAPPFVLPKDQSRDLSLKFTPLDSNWQFSNFIIYGNACINYTFNAKGGFPFIPPVKRTFKLLKPNGGEVIAAGSKFQVKWEGAALSDNIILDLSIDSGKTWTNVTRAGTNLNYDWKVNNVESNRCLMKATESYVPVTESLVLNYHTGFVRCVAWSPDNKYLASCGADSALYIYDTKTFKPIFSYAHNTLGLGTINSLSWSPDSKSIAVSGFSTKICILDASMLPTTCSFRTIKTKHYGSIAKVAFSPNGKYLATGSADGSIEIWTLNPDSLVKNMLPNNFNEDILNFAWSPDNTRIIACTFYVINMYDVALGQKNDSIVHNPYSSCWGIDWSPDNNFVLYGDDEGNLYNYVLSSKLIINLGMHFNHRISAISISPDATMAAICGSSEVFLYDNTDSQIAAQFSGHTSIVNSVSFHSSGMLIASGSDDNTVRIWSTGYLLQSDVSDSLFTIVKPHATSQDIDMGSTVLGGTKDSVINVFVTNTGTVPISIEKIVFSGTNAYDFSLVAGLPPYDIPVGGHSFAEITFTPYSVGTESADMYIITQNDTIKQKITGTGLKRELYVSTYMLDFGKVYVNHSKVIQNADVIKNPTDSNLTIDSTMLTGPDITQFSVINGGGSFSIDSGKNHKITAMFAPTKVGRTQGSVSFFFTGNGSPAAVQMYGEGIASCDSSGFTNQDFTDYSDFNLIESAIPYNGFVRLTPAANNSRGAIWYRNLLPLGKGFTTDFQMRLSGGWNDNQIEHSSPGADGFAFVIQYYNPFAIGNNGGGIGYDGIPNSLAVEFDTYCNDSLQIEDFKDPNGNHVAVQTLGTNPNTAVHGKPQTLRINQSITPLIADSSRIYYARIEYSKESKSLIVYFDNTGSFTAPVIILDSFQLSKILNLKDSVNAYVGITSATGSSYERHDLLTWALCSSTQSLINTVEDNTNMPFDPGLFTVVPNPFGETTSIKFQLYNNSFVTLKILNILGEEVSCLLNNKLEAGFKDIEFSPKGIKSGIYMCELTIDGQTYTKKLVYLE